MVDKCTKGKEWKGKCVCVCLCVCVYLFVRNVKQETITINKKPSKKKYRGTLFLSCSKEVGSLSSDMLICSSTTSNTCNKHYPHHYLLLHHHHHHLFYLYHPHVPPCRLGTYPIFIIRLLVLVLGCFFAYKKLVLRT